MNKKLVSRIVVGSINPVKIGAVRDGFKKLFRGAKTEGMEIDSGVRKQPMSDEETFRGARNRAKKVLKKSKADVAVGLEGGILREGGKLFNTVWCVVMTKKGEEVITGGLHFEIPKAWAKKIKGGMEVGEIMDEMTGEKHIKRKGGMIGVLSRGLIDRKEAYTSLVKLTSIKLLNLDLYNK